MRDQRLYEDGDYVTTGVAALDYTDWRDTSMDEPSIYELFAQVKQHPKFVFGTIFTTDDFEPNDVEAIREGAKHATETMVEAGFQAAEALR